MECIVRFEVKHPEGNKHLRGLIWTGEDGRPTEEQLIQMFKDMKYNVRASEREQLQFVPLDPGARYTSIRITELDTGKEKHTEDRDLKNVISTLMPKRPLGL